MMTVKDTLLESFRVAICAPKEHKSKAPEDLYQACMGHLRQQLHTPNTDRRLKLRAELEKFRKAMIDYSLGDGDEMRDTILTTVNVALDALPKRKPKPNKTPAVKRKRQEQNKFLRTMADTMELDFQELHRLVRFEGLTPGQAAARLVVG